MEQTGRPMTLWRGNCYAHVEFRRDQLLKLRRAFSNPATLRQRLYFLRSVRSASNNKGFGLPCESGGFLITMVNKEFSIVLLIGLILLFVYLFLLGKYGDKTLIGLIFVSGVITFLLYASDDVQRFAAKDFGTEVTIQ